MKKNKNFSSVTLASMVFILILISSTALVGAEQDTSFGPYAYITNSWDHTVSIINTETDTIKATVPVGSYPVGVAINPAGTKVYVTNEGSNDVSVIDTANSTVTANVNVGFSPHGAAVNPDGTKVYVTNYGDNNVSVIDTTTNTVIASVNVGGNPQGVAVTPNGEKVYVANSWDSTVSLIDTTTNTVAATIPVGDSPNGVIVNPEGTKIYVTNSGDRTISVIDTATNTVVATVNVGNWPYGIAINPHGTKIYVANSFSNTVSVIDAATNTVMAIVPVGNDPAGIEVNPEGTKVYVANTGNNTISAIDAATNTVMATISVGSKPICFGQFISSIPEQAQLPVANFSSNVTTGNVPLSVQFTDLSENTAAWNWSFGDGSFSTEQNPTHTYSTAGNYTVTLTVSNGSITNSKLSTITVLEKPLSLTCNVVGIHYKCRSWSNEQYPLINLFEENYIPLTDSGSSIWQSHTNKLSKLVLDSGEKYILRTNEILDLGQGYALEVKQIDIDGNKVWFEFTKDGQYVDDKIISTDEGNGNWVCELDNIQGEYNVPVMKVHVSQIFQGAIEPIVQIDGVWLIDYTNTRTLQVGDEFGEFTLTQIINGTNESNLGSLIFKRSAFENPVYAYISNYGDGTVSVIDTATNIVTATVNIGGLPVGVAVNPVGKTVYVTNWENVSVIDTATNTVTATVNVGSLPMAIAVTPDGTKVYVGNYASENVSVIDTTTNTVTATVNVGNDPSGIAVSPDGKKVYVANNWENNISVIDTATNTIAATVNVGEPSHLVAVTPDGKKVYVTNSGNSTVSVIDTSTNTVSATMNLGHDHGGIAVSPDGKKIYVTNQYSNNVFVIDTATNAVTATVNVESFPQGVAVTPDGTKVYVANSGSNNVSVIDTATNTVTSTVNVGNWPIASGQFIDPAFTQPAFPVANFSSNVTTSITSLSVQFTDLSENATEWNWNFGDGSSSIEHNPIHVYSTAGNYTVTLTVNNSAGSDVVTSQVYIIASKQEDAIIWGVAPLSLQFTDLSENATSWKWNFGDGTSSTEQNPKHTYTKAGQYAVTVTVNNAAGSNTATYTGYISVVNSLEPPIAAFSAYPTYGKLPLNVSFTDNSTGSPTSWKWYFGDGTNSTEQNPTHIYSKAGQYAVTLSVSNVAGSNSRTKLNYISVGNSLKAPVTSFSVSVAL